MSKQSSRLIHAPALVQSHDDIRRAYGSGTQLPLSMDAALTTTPEPKDSSLPNRKFPNKRSYSILCSTSFETCGSHILGIAGLVTRLVRTNINRPVRRSYGQQCTWSKIVAPRAWAIFVICHFLYPDSHLKRPVIEVTNRSYTHATPSTSNPLGRILYSHSGRGNQLRTRLY